MVNLGEKKGTSFQTQSSGPTGLDKGPVGQLHPKAGQRTLRTGNRSFPAPILSQIPSPQKCKIPERA